MVGNAIYEDLPKFYNSKENLFAKKEYTKFFTKEMSENPRYFKTQGDFLIYESDPATKRIIADVK
jgi:hypothetical protein